MLDKLFLFWYHLEGIILQKALKYANMQKKHAYANADQKHLREFKEKKRMTNFKAGYILKQLLNWQESAVLFVITASCKKIETTVPLSEHRTILKKASAYLQNRI